MTDDELLKGCQILFLKENGKLGIVKYYKHRIIVTDGSLIRKP